MTRLSSIALPVLLAPLFLLAGCSSGPSITKDFNKELSVSGPIRLELSNVAGDVQISGSADGKVRVHGSVKSTGMHFGDVQKTINEIAANPPIELKMGTVRIGKENSRFRNVSISYTIEVPRDTEISSSVISGSQSVSGVVGPAKVETASGWIRLDKITRNVQVNALSGAIEVSNVDDDVHANSASGTVKVLNAKGDVRVVTLSGKISVTNPGGRVEASNASGAISIIGANNDVKAHTTSGGVDVAGNPSSNGYWDIQNTSGNAEVSVPANSNFHLTAANTSGAITADIPLVIEEQGKHTLRAHVGDGGGRVEINSISGKIHITSSK